MRRYTRADNHRGMVTGDFEKNSAQQQWERLLVDGHGSMVAARRLFRYLPAAPRCKLCNNPFGGITGRVFAAAGFKPSRKNPNLCTRCCDALPAGGAEVDIAVLFADLRDSTAMGMRADAAEFAALLNRFYVAATRTLLRHDAVIDKLIGDEVMAIFVKRISGPSYRQRAVEAGLDLLQAVGYGTDEGPWLHLGVAINAGVAYVGNVGGAVVDFTALGDPVNVAARMQQHAAGGELLVAYGVTESLTAVGQRRTLTLRGHEQPIDAFAFTNCGRTDRSSLCSSTNRVHRRAGRCRRHQRACRHAADSPEIVVVDRTGRAGRDCRRQRSREDHIAGDPGWTAITFWRRGLPRWPATRITTESRFGYVPQNDIIHREMPLRRTLRYSARLRLPAGKSAVEADRVVEQTRHDLDLADRAEPGTFR